MAIQFGPRLPKGTEPRSPFTQVQLVQGQTFEKPDPPTINPSNPVSTTQGYIPDRGDFLRHGKPGDFTIGFREEEDEGYYAMVVTYRDKDGHLKRKEIEYAKEMRQFFKDYHDREYFGE